MIDTGTDEGNGSSELGAEISQLLGDYTPADESSQSSASEPAAGAPPATASAPAEVTEAVPDGKPDAERAGEPPAAADPATAEAAAPDADPLATSTPATYTVDGKERSYEGIRVLGTDGAVIRPADLPDVLKRLGERDHLHETSQRQYKDLQNLTDLSTWKTKDAEGKDVTYQGAQGIVESRTAFARLEATIGLLDSVFTGNPVDYVTTNEKGEVVWNARALEYLTKDAMLAADQAEKGVRQQIAQSIVAAYQPKPEPTDFNVEAPKLIGAIAKAANLDATLLTDRDRSMLIEQLPFHVQGDKVSVQWQKMVRSLIEDRAERKTATAQIATTATEAAKTNAAKLAAAARGQKPAATAKKPGPAKVPDEREQNQDTAWDNFERAAARAMRTNV